MPTSVHVLSPFSPLSCEDLYDIAVRQKSLRLSKKAVLAMERSHNVLGKIIERGDAVYGLTTGFGPRVRYGGSRTDADGSDLIAHLGAGYGAPIEPEVVRGAMAARLHTLAQGMSGISPETARFYALVLEKNIIADVPSVGSLGASGDLIPLAHIARVMAGEGKVLRRQQSIPAIEALREEGLEPCRPSPRDALALVNGTSFSAAYMALTLVRSGILLARAEELTGWMMRVLGCRRNGLDARLHAAKRHAGQQESARNILRDVKLDAGKEDESRPLQEIYSIRCAPQILGAARDVLRQSKETIEEELCGVDDNPLIDVKTLQILHGGNFMTQHIAFAADSMNSALSQVANLAERQIEALVNPVYNGGASLLLAPETGFTSGMAGVQLTATAIIAEMRSHRQHYASSSLPSNAGNQDIVPLGFQAARECYHQIERLQAVLACEALCVAQLGALRGYSGRKPSWIADFEPLTKDRALRDDIRLVAARMLDNQ